MEREKRLAIVATDPAGNRYAVELRRISGAPLSADQLARLGDAAYLIDIVDADSLTPPPCQPVPRVTRKLCFVPVYGCQPAPELESEINATTGDETKRVP